MKKLAIAAIAAVPIAMLGWALYLILSAPAEPPFGWRMHMSEAQHDAIVGVLDHLYRRAAYAIVWAVQLGYLAWLGVKWQSQKRKSAR